MTVQLKHGAAIDKAILSGKIAVSSQTLEELTLVIFRRKFDKYFLNEIERLEIVDKIAQNSVLCDPELKIFDCRDPKDNMILELAVAANASCIISGDEDLLTLHPFRGIPE
ncbi:putative PIN family toxin of toxin-antitoxin system [Arcticibacter tournemirensis]|uniref:Putative toxin-antitoxin system toxin component, PIN family n=1 Tax=Arcticibacter tournemirensis TaxID=699437 RepID=A0A5M9HK84_9SPHI|nr:putative toxin-antitoxin system toxin component, PIN family [Arcticibacter tournemirensis]KAA8486693.1 putative toxin-antitoxin system toxin component, PIN family [Arcticibacter tournemirensis]TQM49231.1 putative PIN family toxin of toxin-antitoxin system [Arcticibacter tournemirensis]